MHVMIVERYYVPMGTQLSPVKIPSARLLLLERPRQLDRGGICPDSAAVIHTRT